MDNYNPNEAPNRRIKRLIEQENKKERRKEQTRFNDKLFDLLSHIKKHDPRYVHFQDEDRKAKMAKQAEKDKVAKEAAAAHQERLKKHREELAAYYSKKAEEEYEYEDVFVDEYNCTICKKTFKNEGSWNQHLQSKKHKQAASKARADLCFDEETEA